MLAVLKGRFICAAILLTGVLLPNPGFFTVDEWSFRTPSAMSVWKKKDAHQIARANIAKVTRKLP